jgi:hypothetical protein
VACRTDDHASWDRMCPEFLRKSTHFDELHPENALTYFPTDANWTLSKRPEKIPQAKSSQRSIQWGSQYPEWW